MIIQKILLIIIINFVFSNIIYAELKGYSMGGVQTVVSDGYIDVIRNPALMPFSTLNGSYGFAMGYRAYEKENSDVTFNNPVDYNYEVSTDLKSQGDINTGFLFKFGNGAFGMNLNSNDNLFSLKDSTSKLSDGTNSYYEDEDKETVEYNPVLTTSFGYKIDSMQAIGISFLEGFSYKKEKSEKVKVNTASSVNDIEKITKTNYGYNFSMQLGYFIKDDESKTQAGFLIDSGKLSYRKEEIDVNVYQGLISTSFVDKGEDSYELIYTEAPAFIAGISQNLAPKLDVAIEAGFRLPFKYKEDFVDMGDPANFTADPDSIIITEDSEVESKYFFVYRMGFNITLNSRSNLMFGSQYASYSYSQTIEDLTVAESDVKLYTFSTGFEYDLSEKNILSLSVLYSYVDYKIIYYQDITGGLDFESNIKAHSVDVALMYTSYY